MARSIGIRHRVKRTAEGEARPTMVAILEGDKTTTYELEDETAELDFLLARFPSTWRKVTPDEDLSQFLAHHIKYRALQEDEKPESFNTHHLRRLTKKLEVASRVPAAYDGLKKDDHVFMILGGSGDRFAYALSRRGEEVSATVNRMPPFHLKEERGEEPKDNDHLKLANLGITKPQLFYVVGPREREMIRVQEAYRARRDAQRDRIRCEQRLRQRAIGEIFLSEEGKYPEGTVEDAYDAVKANDVILQNVIREEARREAELTQEVRKLDVWQNCLKAVRGCGEVLAAGIITPIGDIRRFATREKLKAFCGAHVLPDGRFPRQRSGSVANWNPSARQALYLLALQFVRRPDSEWGIKYREYKAKFREKHPEVVEVAGKKRYTDMHIHKMAIWRTITKFVEQMFKKWNAIDTRVRQEAA